VRKTLTDEHVEQVAGLLSTFLNWHGGRVLRRRLKTLTEPSEKDKKADAANWREQLKRERDVWLREHPGMTAKDYWRSLDTEGHRMAQGQI
jgi:hypothetical protein